MNRSGSRYRFSVEFIDYKYTGANKTPSLHSQMKSLQKSRSISEGRPEDSPTKSPKKFSKGSKSQGDLNSLQEEQRKTRSPEKSKKGSKFRTKNGNDSDGEEAHENKAEISPRKKKYRNMVFSDEEEESPYGITRCTCILFRC